VSGASLTTENIIAQLTTRRDTMDRYVETYYRFLARKVNILGSDKHELFEIQRRNDQETLLRVFKVKKDSRKKIALIYERLFRNNETREIRLYGLDGHDEFKLEGEVNKGLKVRIIGGGDQDKVIDQSLVRKGGKKTWVYDKPKGMDLQAGPETRSKVADKKGINRYDRQEFRYNYFGPNIFLGFNIDDGVFLGGGVNMTTHAFRKKPYATRQQIKANYAIATNSYNFVYKGEFKEVLGKFDFVLEADLRAPNYVQNFFGLGNETPTFVEENGINFHRIRYEQYLIHPQIRREWLNRGQSLSFGFLFQSVKIENNEDRFVNDFENNGLDSLGLLENRKPFGALSLDYQIDTRKDKLIPTQGFVFKAGMQFVQGLGSDDQDEIQFLRLKSSLSTYLPLGGSTSLALRVGGAHNFGDFLFFQANSLGGSTNLRGYRNFRFAGRSSIYQNTELRIKLFKLRSFLFNGTFGLIGINDIGRVWVNDENSNRLHHGYGGGIWFTPAQALVVSATYTRSSEDAVYFIRFGFLF
ncbi:MAG: BamA/TamA family outer membrane protein, partial [Bacteroidota bacterium]